MISIVANPGTEIDQLMAVLCQINSNKQNGAQIDQQMDVLPIRFSRKTAMIKIVLLM